MGARVSVRSMNRWMLLHILQAGKEPLSVVADRTLINGFSMCASDIGRIASQPRRAGCSFSL